MPAAPFERQSAPANLPKIPAPQNTIEEEKGVNTTSVAPPKLKPGAAKCCLTTKSGTLKEFHVAIADGKLKLDRASVTSQHSLSFDLAAVQVLKEYSTVCASTLPKGSKLQKGVQTGTAYRIKVCTQVG